MLQRDETHRVLERVAFMVLQLDLPSVLVTLGSEILPIPNLIIQGRALINLLNTELIVCSWQGRQDVWFIAELQLLSTISFSLLRVLHHDYFFEFTPNLELFESSWIKELFESQENKALRSNDTEDVRFFLERFPSFVHRNPVSVSFAANYFAW